MTSLARLVEQALADVKTPHRAVRDLGHTVAIDAVPDHWPARIALATALRRHGLYVTEVPTRPDGYRLHVYPDRETWLGTT